MLVSKRFLAFTYSVTKKVKVRNEIGQVIEGYYLVDDYKCAIQPILEKSIKYVWGNNIKSNLEMYCNEELNINDVIIISSKPYKIENKKDWFDYKMYALLETKVKLINENNK
ncbi:MAG: hypothetical protein ACRC28_06195 [Clostridium sp.]|uniref:hypothetical protein n=1 Tax=Clostridia TaxID=186801 RepID=UPI003F3B0D85